jgi:asparagine synthase (glutamine-hydrolysing)
MSVQTGLWMFKNAALDTRQLEHVAHCGQQYGPDRTSHRYFRSTGMIFQAFDMRKPSPLEVQPHQSAAGTIVMWDGRLDNRDELLDLLENKGEHLRDRSVEPFETDADVAIVHAFYDRFGVDSLAKIIGDWAISIWDGLTRRLILATDFCGLRRLYYSKSIETLLWCSDLRSLVCGANRGLELSDEYVIEYLEGVPLPERTPYRNIKAVPPGNWVEVQEDRITTHRYWSWDVSKPLRYRNDLDYEDHFRMVLRQSVARRLRSDYPVVAELSGGLDSSSLVCIAEEIMSTGQARTPALHTLSYYNDQEPTCDERPYFSIIEQQLGRKGTHINSAKYGTLNIPFTCFLATPIYPQGTIEVSQDIQGVMQQHGARTILSGIGGDEVLGGVPTGVPELADVLATWDLGEFLRSAVRWSKVSRSTRWQLIRWTLEEYFARPSARSRHAVKPQASLLTPDRAKAARLLFSCQDTMWVAHDALPSQRMFSEVWYEVVCMLASGLPPIFGCYERAYPYLDRDLLNFLINIPRTQIIRAGQRRSLMRRALRETVPHEVLWRKTKAVTRRQTLATFSSYIPQVNDAEGTRKQVPDHAEYIERRKFVAALSKAGAGLEDYSLPLQRAIGLEVWLRAASEVWRSPRTSSEGQ